MDMLRYRKTKLEKPQILEQCLSTVLQTHSLEHPICFSMFSGSGQRTAPAEINVGSFSQPRISMMVGVIRSMGGRSPNNGKNNTLMSLIRSSGRTFHVKTTSLFLQIYLLVNPTRCIGFGRGEPYREKTQTFLMAKPKYTHLVPILT